MPKRPKQPDRHLSILQLDRQLQQAADVPPVPRIGWIRTIREALNMSAEQLGKRMGRVKSTIQNMEQREAKRGITLRQLDDAAKALDCRVVYALVPEDSLSAFAQRQADKYAKSAIARANLSMGLEAQGVAEQRLEDVTVITSAEAFHDLPSSIWEE